jgi:hypothetical protein
MFKGHKHERERPERERETRERMSGMEKRIKDWRTVSLRQAIVRSSMTDETVTSRCQIAGAPIYSILVSPYISMQALHIAFVLADGLND